MEKLSNNIMTAFFNYLEESKINYLHFKSNTNIDKSFEGKADFDVLVDKNRINDVEAILLRCKGRRHNTEMIGDYPGVDNWIIFDRDSGILYHLHLHYHLVTGKRLVKDYVLPWNDLLFQTRQKDIRYGIYITDPSLELILLATRSVLKASLLDIIKKNLGRYNLSKSMEHEWEDLYAKADWKKVENYCTDIFHNYGKEVFKYIRISNLASWDYLKLSRCVRKDLKLHRRYGGFSSQIQSWYYRTIDLLNKLRSRKMAACPIIKKTSLSGGLIIAFVGVDGAGKSTVTSEIAKWIGRKIECKRFYMGTGDGKTTILASSLKKVNKFKNNSQLPVKSRLDAKSGKLNFISSPLLYLKKYLKLKLVMSVQQNNIAKLKKMHRYRLNGGISVLDRFPQIEMERQNDGPKVCIYRDIFGDTFFIKRAMKKEKDRLNIVNYIKPDLIFRLNISAEVSMKRKPEQTDIDMYRKKIEDLNRITFQGAQVIDIDAEQPYDKEMLEIKRILWEFI